jgi:hypothetical protein
VATDRARGARLGAHPLAQQGSGHPRAVARRAHRSSDLARPRRSAGARDIHVSRSRGRRQVRRRAVPADILLLGAVFDATVVGGRWAPVKSFGRTVGWPDFGVVGFLLLSMVVTGFGEETSWRGFALPRLQAKSHPFQTRRHDGRSLRSSLAWTVRSGALQETRGDGHGQLQRGRARQEAAFAYV